MRRNCMGWLRKKWQAKKFLCVGLDSDEDLLPPVEWHNEMAREHQLIFNKAVVDATHDLVCAYKPNFAFYASGGLDGLWVLEKTIAYIHEHHTSIPVILDGKWGDIGSTSKKYAEMAFDWLKADAVTVNPYLGRDSLEPFLEQSDKGIFILCRTSNPGAGEFQDFDHEFIMRGCSVDLWYERLYEKVAYQVAQEWNKNGNCGLVVGATSPDELAAVRKIAPELPILIPGVGSQGGNLEAAVQNGKNAKEQGFIINASRSIIFASREKDFAEKARREAKRLHMAIKKTLRGG